MRFLIASSSIAHEVDADDIFAAFRNAAGEIVAITEPVKMD